MLLCKWHLIFFHISKNILKMQESTYILQLTKKKNAVVAISLVLIHVQSNRSTIVFGRKSSTMTYVSFYDKESTPYLDISLPFQGRVATTDLTNLNVVHVSCPQICLQIP